MKGDPTEYLHGHNTRKAEYTFNTQGYPQKRIAADHPMASMRNSGGYVMMHRLVMAEHLGRPLIPQEVIHHINEDIRDFRLSNLQLFASVAEHSRHHSDLVPIRERGKG